MPKKSPGQTFTVPPATEWNAMIDAGRHFAERQALGTGDADRRCLSDNNTLTIRNDSGGALVAGHALEIGAKLLGTVTRDGLWFAGDTPAPDGSKLWGLTRFPQDDGATARNLIVAGLAMAVVTINDEQHVYADVADGYTTLSSGWHGVPIVWKPTGTGELTCVVLLGQRYNGPWTGVVYEEIDAGFSGLVTVWWQGAETDTPDRVTCWYDWMDPVDTVAAAGKECLFQWFPDVQKYRIVNMEC